MVELDNHKQHYHAWCVVLLRRTFRRRTEMRPKPVISRMIYVCHLGLNSRRTNTMMMMMMMTTVMMRMSSLGGSTENAGMENAGPSYTYRGGKCETSSYVTPKLQLK